MGQDLQFTVDTAAFEQALKANIILDKYYDDSENLLLVFVGPKSDSADIFNRQEACDYGDWTHDIPKNDKYLYSVGAAPGYYYKSSSWQEATQKALIELAHQISSDIKALNKYEGYNVYKTVIEEGDVVLKKWQVVARKIDPSNDTYNVLIRMPLF